MNSETNIEELMDLIYEESHHRAGKIDHGIDACLKSFWISFFNEYPEKASEARKKQVQITEQTTAMNRTWTINFCGVPVAKIVERPSLDENMMFGIGHNVFLQML